MLMRTQGANFFPLPPSLAHQQCRGLSLEIPTAATSLCHQARPISNAEDDHWYVQCRGRSLVPVVGHEELLPFAIGVDV